MLKIRDDIDLKELKKYGLEPLYRMVNEKTGETKLVAYISNKYQCKFGYLSFYSQEKGFKEGNKILRIFMPKRIIQEHLSDEYFLNESSYVDTDLLYDLIKADLVEKVEDK